MLTAEQLLRDMLKQMQQTLHSQANTAYDQLVDEQRAFLTQFKNSLATMHSEQTTALQTLQTTQDEALIQIKKECLKELDEQAEEVTLLNKQVAHLITLLKQQNIVMPDLSNSR